MKRKLILRDYQNPISDFAMSYDITVLALAPSGGKTEISIDVIERYIKANLNLRVLVLTHSTNILKDNYMDRLDNLEVSFTYSSDLNSEAQVHICLPHSEFKLKGRKYGLVIVDEAHENYFANRVQRILEDVKPEKQVLLTGSPSGFIKKGNYKIYTLGANQIPEEYLAKLQVELVVSDYKFSKELNSDYNVKNEYVFVKKQTESTLEAILLKLLDRLKLNLTASEFNEVNTINKVTKFVKSSWGSIYKKIGKTIIVCKRIEQANDINEILLKNGVNSILSHSELDEGENVQDFKDNKYDVLVVVNRAKLGYNDVDLMNIIDMSGTHNPDMINQIYSRVLRGNPDMQKYYLKITTKEYGMMDFTTACVNASLMLTDTKYLSTFNGDNFKGIKIPVIKKPIEVRDSSKKTKKNIDKNDSIKDTNKLVFPEYTNDVISMFKNIIHDIDKPVSIYKLITIQEVRGIITNQVVWTEEKILATIYGD